MKCGRYEGEIRLRDLEIVPDDPVVPQLQRADPGCAAFLRQVPVEHFPRAVLQSVQPVQVGVVAAADEVSLGEHDGRLFTDRPCQEPGEVAHLLLRAAPGAPQASGCRPGPRGPLASEQSSQRKDRHEGRADGKQVLRVRAVHRHPGRQAFQVENGAEGLPKSGQEHLLAVQRLHRGKPPLDGRALLQRGEDPSAQLARPGEVRV